jgi:hypothetical protein
VAKLVVGIGAPLRLLEPNLRARPPETFDNNPVNYLESSFGFIPVEPMLADVLDKAG